LKIAFFALLHDQDLATPIVAFARDAAGNEATTLFVEKVFEKPFKRSRIAVDDAYFKRSVPDILTHSPEVKDAPADDLRVVGPEESGDRAERGGLAGAVGAEQRDDRARRHAERHALDRGRDVVVDDLEILKLEHVGHDAGRSGR